MAETSIEWTDRVWNPVTGCTKVSPGCAHCSAETIANRKLPHGGFTDRPFTEVRTHRDRLAQPLSWRKPARVFVNSMSDLFHEDVPDAFIDEVFAAMALAPDHTFQVLTKRPARMLAYLNDATRCMAVADAMDMPDWLPAGRRFLRVPENWPMPNVWLGVSVENQRFADERIPLLLETPAAMRFISAEPLLGPIRFADVPGFNKVGSAGLDLVRNMWVIVGGESGAQARPFDLEWARSIVRQCRIADVPVFVKQLGAVPVMAESEWRANADATGMARLLSHRNHRRAPAGSVPLHVVNRKGGDMAEWPEDLRIRQMPKPRMSGQPATAHA